MSVYVFLCFAKCPKMYNSQATTSYVVSQKLTVEHRKTEYLCFPLLKPSFPVSSSLKVYRNVSHLRKGWGVLTVGAKAVSMCQNSC